MELKKENKRIHYAWVIFALCTCSFTSVTGMIANTYGLFYQPVSAHLGVSLSSFTSVMIVYGVMSSIMFPFTNRILIKANIRVLYGVAHALFFLAYFLMGFYTKLWMWYVSFAVMGLCFAFCGSSLSPFLINRWFVKKRSTVLSLVTAISAGVGIFITRIASRIIADHGYKMAYYVIGITAFLISVPLMVIFVRKDPSEMGLTPYGAEETVTEKKPAKFSAKFTLHPGELSIFLSILIASFVWGAGNAYVHHLSSYGTSIGLDTVMAGTLLSYALIGNMGGKLILGPLNERYGVKKTTPCVMLLMIFGMVLLIIGQKKMALLKIGGALLGLAMPVTVLQMPLVMWDLFDRARYTAIYNVIMIAVSLMQGVANSLLGLMYTSFGSYVPCYIISICGYALALVLFLYAYYRRKKVDSMSQNVVFRKEDN